MVEEKIGIVEHFFTNVNVAAVRVTSGELKIGDTIHFVILTASHNPFTDVGIKVNERVREHDIVYKITEE